MENAADSSMSVLLVDDAEDFRVMLRARLALRNPSFAFSEADSGQMASVQLHQSSFDLVISDAKMENGTGYWLYHFMRENFPDVPLIIFTADPTGFPARPDQTLKAIIGKNNINDLLAAVEKCGGRGQWNRRSI